MNIEKLRRNIQRTLPDAQIAETPLQLCPELKLCLICADNMSRRFSEDEIRIIDIALLSQQRNKGVGSGLLRDILTEAGEKNIPVRIHVEKFNPALNLYQRLGFKEVEDSGVYLLMEWIPR